ncbi:MAG TPA: RNA methyltransferase, partial [Solirubrobacteraceae bacterium]
GRNAVFEALRGRRAKAVSEIWATVGAAREEWLKQARPKIVAAEEIERRCGSNAHQGICADAGGYPYVSSAELLAVSQPLIVALDQVQDPQNLGSICRTAECVGAAGVVIPERRAAEVTPAVCKASAGAVEHLRIARVRNMADFLADARQAGCWCYGASGEEDDGEESARAGAGASTRSDRAARRIAAYDAPDYAGAGVVLVLGSEGSGLRPRVAKACDELIALPLLGRIESLGVSAAAAAILYEILQVRGAALDNSP